MDAPSTESCEVLYHLKNVDSRLGGVLGTDEGGVGAIVYPMPNDAQFGGNLKAGLEKLKAVDGKAAKKPSEEDNKPI